MTTKILIPTPLRPYADRRDAVEADGQTVGELLADLTRKHAGLRAHLFNEQGKLRSFVNVYVNDEGHPVPAERADPGVSDRHGQHSPVGRGRHANRYRHAQMARCASRPSTADQRRGEKVQPALDHAGGRHGRAATTQGGQRAVHRRGRARIAGRNVPCCRRRRHRRYRGLRRRGPQQPPAPDHPRDVGRRPVEAGLGKGSNSRD